MNPVKLKTFAEHLLTMPVEYPGEIKYMATDMFPVISIRNINSYEVLGEDARYAYMLKHDSGFVFDRDDLANATPSIGCRAVMVVSLRPGIKGLFQAHRLRVREASSEQNTVKSWYDFYAKAKGGVVSDFEHLQGGKALWVSLIKTGHVTSCWKTQDAETPVTEADIPNLWSAHPNHDNKDLVLIYRPRK